MVNLNGDFARPIEWTQKDFLYNTEVRPKDENISFEIIYERATTTTPVPEFIDPRFRENKPKTLVFSHRKQAFWACFRENCAYNFGHRIYLLPAYVADLI
jgi:hypothetical protein